MATTMVDSFTNHHPVTAAMPINPNPLRVCFSYAAYAKHLIHHLRSAANIPVEPGLSEAELSAVEASLHLAFPPDLRCILREGLPVGPGFPNWRSSSKQQLEVLTSLPVMGICKEVSRNGFWIGSWGERPDDIDRAVKRAKGYLRKAPVLVPIYDDFYIPSEPCMAGNPVFHVHGGEVRLWSFDIAGFFRRFDFVKAGGGEGSLAAPAWAATEARRIEVWTDIAARGGWWGGGEVGGWLEGVWRRLRGGGWGEEEVREMIMDGGDVEEEAAAVDRESVERRVRVMSGRLLCGGWSREDVVETMGTAEDCCCDGDDVVDGDWWIDFQL